VRFSRMPLAPSCWLNVRVEHRIQKYYRGIRPPWPAEEYVFGSCIRGYTAVIKNIAALGRQEYKLMRDGMNFTMFEHCFAIAENISRTATSKAVWISYCRAGTHGPSSEAHDLLPKYRVSCAPSILTWRSTARSPRTSKAMACDPCGMSGFTRG
jgi:hypothetical protein